MTYVFPLKVYNKRIIPENPGYHKVFAIPLKRKIDCISKVKKYHCLCNENIYKSYRNELKKLLRAVEKKYYCDLITKYRNDSKKIRTKNYSIKMNSN